MDKRIIIDRELYLDTINEYLNCDIKFDVLADLFDVSRIKNIIYNSDVVHPIHQTNKDEALSIAFDDNDLQEAIKMKTNILVEKKYLDIKDEIQYVNDVEYKENINRINEVIEFLNELIRTVPITGTSDQIKALITQDIIPSPERVMFMINLLNNVLTSKYFNIENI